jgi:hypothetical protein
MPPSTLQSERYERFARSSRTAGDHDALDDVALDVEPEDRLGRRLRVVGGLGDLDAAGLAATADLDLGLDDGHAAHLLRCGSRFLGGVGDDSRQDGHAVGLEQVPGLVLEKIHAVLPIRIAAPVLWRGCRPSRHRPRRPPRVCLDVGTNRPGPA